ncbi:MAG: hypothetical protein ABR540_03755 [Acidimicrobiales bacterium]
MRTTGRRSAAPVTRTHFRLRTAALAAAMSAVGLGLAAATPLQAAPADAARPIALVLVRDLTWSTAPSSLDGFARANLSMRTAEAEAEPADVYLSLGKGGRSAALEDGAGAGRIEATPGGGLRLVDWPALQKRDRDLHFGGTLGLVGETLKSGGRRWALASDDKDAAAAAASADGMVPRSYPGTVDGIESAMTAELDAIFVAIPRSQLSTTLRALDGTCTLVASASTPTGSRHLGVLAVSAACGLGSAGLASPSTHHAHLVTLPDVSRTFLEMAGIPRPSSIGGAVVTPAAAVDRENLVERDRRTWTADRSRTAFVWLFVVLHALGALIVIVWRRARTVVCCALLAIPSASLLMMLVPWWRAGAWLGLLLGGAVAALIAVGGAVLVRRDPAVGIAAVAAFTSAVVAVDALFGSPLQIDAPFGNSPVVAGRFYGVGNIGSGFLVAGLLVAGGLAIDRWGRRAVPWVGGAFGMGAVAGGAPQFGADIGGVLFAVPAYGLLLLGARRARVTVRHVLLLAGAAATVVALFVAVDLVRGAGSQTHLAQSVGGDGLGDEVIRKASRAIQTVKAPMANLVVIAAAGLVWTRFSPGPRSALRFASYAVLVAAVVGSLLNDSGVNVAAAVAAVAWPAGVLVSSRSEEVRPAVDGVLV